VAIASRLTPEVRPVLPVMTEEGRAEVSKMLEKLSSGGILQAVTTSSLSYQTVGIDPHEGTREGARAAWGCVAMKLTRSADSIKENMRKPDANTDCCVSRLKLNRVADRYRRELEAI
jgi:pyruvate/2-oxoglutarate dehydrogenase complex dihydrolipoamide dehydrogenase (E3) component